MRDLLDLDLDVSALLPGDDVSYGFDNIAGVLKLSPTLMERYLSAAQKMSRLAVGTPPRTPSIDYYRVTDDLSQDVQLPGLPLGTRGGTRISYAFPMDAVYEIRPRLTRDLNESLPLYTEPQRLEISIDGERVGTFTLPGIGAREGRGAPPPSLTSHRADPPATRAAVARPGARASGDLADCADRPRQREGARSRATAPTNRGTCACRSRLVSATSSSPSSIGCRRSTRARVCRSCVRIRPVSTFPRRVWARICAASRSSARSTRPDPDSPTAAPHLHVLDEG